MSFDLIDFTDHLRYLPYNAWDNRYYNKLQVLARHSIWRNHYHIEPDTGLLNDPNGFCYFNKKWHLFYQHYPYGPVHGLKSWHHLESEDLVHWEDKGLALKPDTKYDSHGAYSGSAYAIGDRLFLFYTGNTRDQNWVRTPYQLGAWLDQEDQVTKIDTPLITQPKGTTDHFRDPQIFEYEGQYYAIIGAQTATDHSGRIDVYQAVNNDVTHWRYLGILDLGETALGYMVECPNLVFIEGRPVLIFCPQGLQKSIQHYDNIYPNMVVVGERFDPRTVRIIGAQVMTLLDDGFEMYATLSFNAPGHRALSVGWIGLPDIVYPNEKYGVQGALSLVRELTLRDDKLCQYPVSDTLHLRQEEKQVNGKIKLKENAYELEVCVPKGTKEEIRLFQDEEDRYFLSIIVDASTGEVMMDRSHTRYPFATDYGQKRKTRVKIEESGILLNLFVDTSIVECFVNKGEHVLTARFFADETDTFLSATNGTCWNLKQ